MKAPVNPPPWLRFTVTISGDQGALIHFDQVLPLCLLNDARELQRTAEDLVKVHHLTTQGWPLSHIANHLGRSTTWVKARQRTLGLCK